eukprot:359284-Chlamydomonas_euryale.AAC.3
MEPRMRAHGARCARRWPYQSHAWGRMEPRMRAHGTMAAWSGRQGREGGPCKGFGATPRCVLSGRRQSARPWEGEGRG